MEYLVSQPLEGREDAAMTFCEALMAWLLSLAAAKDKTVRTRVCQLLNRIMHALPAEACLDEVCACCALPPVCMYVPNFTCSLPIKPVRSSEHTCKHECKVASLLQSHHLHAPVHNACELTLGVPPQITDRPAAAAATVLGLSQGMPTLTACSVVNKRSVYDSDHAGPFRGAGGRNAGAATRQAAGCARARQSRAGPDRSAPCGGVRAMLLV